MAGDQLVAANAGSAATAVAAGAAVAERAGERSLLRAARAEPLPADTVFGEPGLLVAPGLAVRG